MSFIRAEARAALARWREVALSLGFVAFGLWIVMRGGWFYGVIGTAVIAFALGLALTAWRRLRFRAGRHAPGIVQYDEGAIAYFGPETGGVVALSEVMAVSAVARPEGLVWRIAQSGGPPVEIPVGARGAERLFDTFAALPGARPAAFLDAIEKPPAGERRVWQRTENPAEARLPRQ